MIDTAVTLDTSFEDYSKSEWMDAVKQVAQNGGFYEALGSRHHAMFLEKSSTLLVSFETINGMRALSSMAHPLGWEMVRSEGWSHLCLASEGDTWFRDAPVYVFFDRLIDDGFFDGFDRVVFYGAGPGGYAAAAFSVAAPGAKVVAIQPQATLDPSVTEWDDRFVEMRRTDFTSRFGYAPDMLDAAEAAFVIYDPTVPLDAMHASLFTRPNVTKLRMRRMGTALQSKLLELDQFEAILTLAAEDALDIASFARCARARRDHRPYLRGLLNALEQDQRESLILTLCRFVNDRTSAPRFARRQKQLEAEIALRNAAEKGDDTDQGAANADAAEGAG
ncbi:phosphoadenosine phosphosulfate reductase [uncultured Sulfitobacter sp.]|uniref:phosphoadenosine phosphosulfate reductase n=1 Tax=uncultured Sulfitobacter sp. TaxID=191468 RepID=UPI002594EA86|nr:phosphoadenosine phosphosulfate reductase [uncultured Sulfitobacter sp.]